MKNLLSAAVLTVAALGLAASAQAQTFNATFGNGDLIAGFTGDAPAGTDFIYDLGTAAALFPGETWQLTPSASTQFGVIGAIKTGVNYTIFATSSDAGENGWVQSGQGQTARGNILTLGASLSNGTATPAPSDTASWSFQTAQPANTPGSSFQNNYFNPNVAISSDPTTAYVFQNVNGTTTPVGTFSYSPTAATLTFQPVPEPGTFALIGLGGMAALALRRRSVKA